MENRLHDTAIPTIFPSRPSVKRKLYNAEASGWSISQIIVPHIHTKAYKNMTR